MPVGGIRFPFDPRLISAFAHGSLMMAPLNSDARMLIAVRVVVVTTLLMASLIIQYTVSVVPPDQLPLPDGWARPTL